jgi:oxalate decarboxylase/phosphoglucose isomerase-like protein (cupin superfamily)
MWVKWLCFIDVNNSFADGGLMNGGESANNEIRVVPFMGSLPDDNTKYFPILNNKQNCLKLHSGMVRLQPGESVGEHSTEDHEELIIVMSGSGELEVEGLGRREIAAGQIAYNPPNTKHNIINTGNESMRYIYIVTKVL